MLGGCAPVRGYWKPLADDASQRSPGEDATPLLGTCPKSQTDSDRRLAMQNEIPDSLAGDKLRNAQQIAAFIDEPVRKTFNLLANGHLPARKVGRDWVASKAALVRHYRQTTSGQAA
jgi:hypothetical protein